jgi:hypothetical protein
MPYNKYNIIYISPFTDIFQCSPWRNSIKLFLDSDHEVIVYQFHYNRNVYFKSEIDNKYLYFGVPRWKVLIYLLYPIKIFFRLFKSLGLKTLSTYGDAFAYILWNTIFIVYVYNNVKNSINNTVLIAGDPIALFLINLINKANKKLKIYWPLELWVQKDLYNPAMKLFKCIEKKYSRDVALVLNFGERRSNILREENNIQKERMLIIPNSPLGKPEIKRNFFFNDKFNIPRSKKIILHAGGFADNYGIKEIIESVRYFPSDCVLIIHTKSKLNKYNNSFMNEIFKNTNIYLNDTPVPFDMVSMIYSSCDIGLQLWKPNKDDGWYTNLLYSDLSSGKEFHYLQFGIPLIVRDSICHRDLIENNGAGVCINHCNEIGEAINKILRNEIEFKKNCVKLFQKYRFEKYHEDIVVRIEEILQGKESDR